MQPIQWNNLRLCCNMILADMRFRPAWNKPAKFQFFFILSIFTIRKPDMPGCVSYPAACPAGQLFVLTPLVLRLLTLMHSCVCCALRAWVAPQVCSQVGMRVVYACVNNSHDNVTGPCRCVPRASDLHGTPSAKLGQQQGAIGACADTPRQSRDQPGRFPPCRPAACPIALTNLGRWALRRP